MFPKYCSRKNAANLCNVKMNLKYDYRFKFLFNSAFNEKKIKYTKYYNNYQSSSPTFNDHLNNIIKILRSKYKKTDKVLEIGC